MINEVKEKLGSMGDGEISISAYDTAWVALVQSSEGDGRPQFPSSLKWIVDQQLADGSWGDETFFSAHDRMINTLACVIALESWSTCPEKCERGLIFLRENLWRLAEEEDELMTVGFEVAFPSLIDMAKAIGLQIPYDNPALQKIYAKRNRKLEKIPKQVMHEVPTTLLFSLEGMQGLDWSKLLKLQSLDGSFLFSPSSTAYALMQTANDRCLQYLQRVVDKFNGGVPNAYPVDLFEHLWVVDRLERLGISRFFEEEVKECLDYVHRYWTDDGIGWVRNCRAPDIDDTSMGFRFLRLHGYDVSPVAINNFEKDGEFFCCAGQANQAITAMYNLNRASQLMFPGEDILWRAKNFSYSFLREKQASNQLLDKWIITKDLPGEVEYALDFPFLASLPRVETRWFLEQYGGGSDIWIGKTLYRMPMVNNDLYLNLAKADFNRCQGIHRLEWQGLQKWYEECKLGEHGVSKESMLRSYFLAMACIFEPDRAIERLGWAKTAIHAEDMALYFRSEGCTEEAREDFVKDFHSGNIRSTTRDGMTRPILQLIDHLARSIIQQQERPNQQIHHHLQSAWTDWMLTWSREHDDVGLLLVRTVELCRGSLETLMAQPEHAHLAKLTSLICSNLQHRIRFNKDHTNGEKMPSDGASLELQVQEFLKCVLQNSDARGNRTKKTFLYIVKSFYYAAHWPLTAFDNHITKVLFERVV